MTDLPRIVPAAVTPFSEGGKRVLLDWIPQHMTLLEHRGADGALYMGTNGEGPSLSMRERRDIVDATITVRGRLSVMFGTGCASLPETVELSRYAIERGADAVLIVPPFYFKDLDTSGLVSYYSALLEALPPERKVLLYNIPGTSAVEITDDLVATLAERYPERLLGLKDTSGSIERTRAFVERFPQLAVYNGWDAHIDEALAAGVTGTISGIANVYADMVADVFEAHHAAGDVAGAQAALDRRREAIAGLPQHAAMKRLLHIEAGLPLTYVRPPLRELTLSEVDALTRAVTQRAGV